MNEIEYAPQLLSLSSPALLLPPGLAALVIAWGAFVGATVGSFLNVVIARLPMEGQSIVRPRSRCPSCGHQIAWYDNIPVLSWILLRAKCRGCGTEISPRYILVELFVGALGAAIVIKFGASMRGLELFLFAAALVAVAYIDIDTWTIPWELLGFIALLGLGFGGLEFLVDGPPPRLLVGPSGTDLEALGERLIGGGVGFLSLGSLIVILTPYFRWRGRIGPEDTAMGWGDPLLLAGIGLVVGWRALPAVILLACVQGIAAAGVLALMPQKEKPIDAGDDWVPPESAIQFGPFLALGAMEVAFFSEWLLPFFQSAFGGLSQGG